MLGNGNGDLPRKNSTIEAPRLPLVPAAKASYLEAEGSGWEGAEKTFGLLKRYESCDHNIPIDVIL